MYGVSKPGSISIGDGKREVSFGEKSGVDVKIIIKMVLSLLFYIFAFFLFYLTLIWPYPNSQPV